MLKDKNWSSVIHLLYARPISKIFYCALPNTQMVDQVNYSLNCVFPIEIKSIFKFRLFNRSVKVLRLLNLFYFSILLFDRFW